MVMQVVISACRELMKKALPVLVNILEKEARGWFLHFREKVIADLKAQNLSDYEVEKVGVLT